MSATPEESFVEHAGFVLFPRNPGDLTSTTTCPACFTQLTSTTCSKCALDLAHPAAAALAAASTTAAADLGRRLDIIGRIRFETAQGSATAVAAFTATATATAISAATAIPQPAATLPSVQPARATDDAPPRRFGVQVILLIVGVSLLAIGAIFFLVYAFITFGLVWRSVIIGAVTVAAFVSASLLTRRRLTATAEAIAALAVVFVYLDAFAIRANDLFGAAAADGLTYWGAALVASAIGFTVWHRTSGLRLPSIVAAISIGPGIALFVAGATDGLDDSARSFTALVGVGLSGLAFAATKPIVERAIVLWFAAFGLGGAFVAAFFLVPYADWGATLGLLVVALIALAEVVLVARLGVHRTPGFVIAAVGAAAAAVAIFAAMVRVDVFEVTVIASPVSAVVVALALEFVARRRTASSDRMLSTVAAVAAAAVAGLTLLIPLVTSLNPVLGLAAGGARRWTVAGGTITELGTEVGQAVIALAVVIGLAAGAWAMQGILVERRPALVWAGAAVAVLAAPLAGLLWLTVIAWLVLGAAGVGALNIAQRRGSGAALRPPVIAGTAVAIAFAYSASWASIDTWWFGSVASVVLLVVARLATRTTRVRALLVAAATVLAFVAVGSEGWHLNERFQRGMDAPLEATHFVAALAILLLVVAAALASRLSVIETRVLYWLAFGAAAVTVSMSFSVASAGSLVLPDFVTSALLATALLLALLLWVAPRGTSAFVVERVAASIAIAPAAAWLLLCLARQFGASDFIMTLAPLGAALLIAAAALTLVAGRRWALDVGVGLVAIPAVIAGVSAHSDASWLVLLAAALVTLLLAVSRDGLFSSASGRKHLGWAALALAVAALWTRLGDSNVHNVEPYVLPLAGVLLLVALFTWRAERTNAVATSAPPIIFLTGLLVAIIPVASTATSGPELRTVLITIASATLLLVGSFSRRAELRQYLDAGAIAGFVGILIAALGRSATLAAAGRSTDISLDAWLGGAFLVLALAGLAQARLGDRSRLRGILSQLLIIVALAATLLIEVSILRDNAAGPLRAGALLAVFGVLHVLGIVGDRPPVTRLVGWLAIVFSATVGVAASVTGAIDKFEWATAAIGAALLAAGAVRMRRLPTATSWQWLAPGLFVLLLPTLVATFGSEPELWRLVTLGVTCLVVIVLGAMLRLQAALMIGAAVVLVHGIRTFAPQLIAVYQSTQWWVWAVVGGGIILFLGLTFEKRVRDLRFVGSRIGALR